MSQIHDILKRYWGYNAFRPLQEDIIQSVLLKQDTLALLPTGGGKSICFQVPALAVEGICIVISPLIALMKDQVEQLKKRNIPAVALYSGLTRREIDIILDNCVFNHYKFLYVSPERIQTELFIERVKRMKVSLLAIDEAHCISQWGYDFRPPYLEIIKLRDILPQIPVIALTATATKEVKADILDKLAFRQPKVYQKSFARENLSYSAFQEEDKERKMLTILQNVPGSAVVYTRSRKRTQQLAEWLLKTGISADFYHAGLNNDQRSYKQDAWINNHIRVIVATNAFGMGIDKPDVRTVIHMDLPDSLEAYYQEAGRAGRDEKKAYAVALFNKSDLEDLKHRVEQAFPPVDFIRRVYQSLANYYQIAAGSGYLANYNFELEDFCKTYKLQAGETYHALKRLEDEGFIQLNEAFFSPSKVFFTIDKKQLYEFQVANASYDPLIKMLLRLYGGELFTSFMIISEQALARQLQASRSDIEKMLTMLHSLQVLIYDKQKDKPQLTFTTVRFNTQDLPIQARHLEIRKQQELQKIGAVIDYVTHQNRCRTLLLLAYFDEISELECGVCDNCIEKKKQKDFKDYYYQHRKQIMEALSSQEISVQQLLHRIKPKDEKALIDTLREMTNTGEIRYNAKGNIYRVQPNS
ncbi:RecQ family ATP-dependent DNA helicase [Rhodocytophaga rosea]|uniref:ATP-dependent DNA helicase RecQ n=1 Tax=Rhodocytophaga rosea TaxID=2704465 RepID=A0A6C0GPZ0_9BACT|nr:ATP-dependent DNA helicase RecQ [Rhodocytophaga rosea]QHT69683.1 RecQ family ATP-dependent DNA helicase [Rhodocytophaga rosea]